MTLDTGYVQFSDLKVGDQFLCDMIKGSCTKRGAREARVVRSGGPSKGSKALTMTMEPKMKVVKKNASDAP